MENIEFMLKRTRAAREQLAALADTMSGIQGPSNRAIREDLNKARAGNEPDDRAKLTRVIGDARESAWQRMRDLQTELEVLAAALDDAIGKAGRLF